VKAPAKRPVAKSAGKKAAAPKRNAGVRKPAQSGASSANSSASANGGGESSNALTRVTRVAKELAQQTTTAVTEGVEKMREMSGSLVDRVTG
jgi:hypothetical protein